MESGSSMVTSSELHVGVNSPNRSLLSSILILDLAGLPIRGVEAAGDEEACGDLRVEGLPERAVGE